MARFTHHAEVRAQQRGIQPLIVDWLWMHGEIHHDHCGAIVRYFNKRSRKKLASIYGSQVVKSLRQFLDTYIVTDDREQVITVGHRYRPIRN